MPPSVKWGQPGTEYRDDDSASASDVGSFYSHQLSNHETEVLVSANAVQFYKLEYFVYSIIIGFKEHALT